MNASRLPFVLLVFIVIPTAVLSLLAARSLKQGEILEQRRQEAESAIAVRSVVDQVDARLKADLERAADVMTDALAAGGDARVIRKAACRIEDARPLVAQVYLFVNPWGFLWPEHADANDPAHDALLTGLRRGIAGDPTAREPVILRHAGEAYLFLPIGGRGVYLVGYRVDRDAAAGVIATALADAARQGVGLGARGPGIRVTTDGVVNPGAVVVEDSFGQRDELTGTPILADRAATATASLRPPFAEVSISAYNLSDPMQERTGGLRSRLYYWGILMLAGGIIVSAWLVAGRAIAEMRRARYRNDFIAGVSHDLRTPIASIRVMAESLFLGRVAEGERRQKFLGTIVDECERLNQLTERVLFLVRFGQNAVRYKFTEVALGTITHEVVEVFRQRYSCKTDNGQTPDVRLVNEANPVVALDVTAYRQVLVNLLDNAVKYGSPADLRGGASLIEVRVSVARRRRNVWAREKAYACAEVRDHGPGIAARDRRRVFRRYYRAPVAADENVSGVGLGLAVCRHAAAAHGGWIEVVEGAGGGAAFRVYIPVLENSVSG